MITRRAFCLGLGGGVLAARGQELLPHRPENVSLRQEVETALSKGLTWLEAQAKDAWWGRDDWPLPTAEAIRAGALVQQVLRTTRASVLLKEAAAKVAKHVSSILAVQEQKHLAVYAYARRAAGLPLAYDGSATRANLLSITQWFKLLAMTAGETVPPSAQELAELKKHQLATGEFGDSQEWEWYDGQPLEWIGSTSTRCGATAAGALWLLPWSQSATAVAMHRAAVKWLYRCFKAEPRGSLVLHHHYLALTAELFSKVGGPPGRDWAREVALFLINTQKPDGSWVEAKNEVPLFATCAALRAGAITYAGL